MDSEEVGPIGITPPRRRRPALRAVIVIAVIIIVALLLLTPAAQGFLRDLIASPFRERYPASATFTLERSVIIDPNAGEVVGYNVDISVPDTIMQNGYTLQEVTSINYSPSVTTSEVRYGQDWITWDSNETFSGHARELTATFQMTVSTHVWDIDESNSLTISDVPAPLKAQYLNDEWKIEMTDPSVVATSKAIVGSETDVYLILKNIYDWMLKNIDYPTFTSSGGPQSASYTLSSGVGDCDDQSILFCALARAAGVPAWLQMGALLVTAENNWGGHGWLQAYVPLAGGGGERVTIDVVNKDFLVFRPNRFVDFTDDGNADHLTDYYSINIISYNSSRPPPSFTETYTALSYHESSEKITRGTVYSAELLTPAGTARAKIRI